MLWIALYVLAGLVGLVILMAVIGSFLPRDHVATRSATLAPPPAPVWRAPPAAVWRALTDVDAQPTWRRGLKRLERLSPTTFREHSSQGAITFEIVEERAPG